MGEERERKEVFWWGFFLGGGVLVNKQERGGIFPEKPRHLLSAVRRPGEQGIERCRSSPRWSLGAPPPPQPLTNWEERPRA